MKKKLIYTSLALFALSFISKILAFAKEALLAYNYGASNITDGYIMSQNIITAIFGTVTSALTIGYIATMVNQKNYSKTLNGVLNISFLIFSIMSVFLFIFAPYIVKLFAPGFSFENLLITTKILRIMLPHICHH